MGAYELYLRELGFSTNQRQGNNVGFQIFIESRSDFEATDDDIIQREALEATDDELIPAVRERLNSNSR